MKGSIRGVAATFLALLGLTAVWLTVGSTYAGSRYGDDPRNTRTAVDLDGPRGRILTADGVVLAEDDGSRRSYPRSSGYAHLVGYDDGEIRTGLESTRIREMLTRDDGSLEALLVSLTGGDLGPPDLHLTVVDALQRAAIDALGGRTGAVVAMDPTTGAILAYVSSPSFDPNTVASGARHRDDLDATTAIDRVAHRLLPPGSTFKTIVAAAALDRGADLDTLFDDAADYTPPGGIPINNAVVGPCRNGTITLLDAFVVSCNTVFAELAVDLGAGPIVAAAARFGFNARIPWELGNEPGVVPAAADLDADTPALAQSGIGERDVRATPLLMAMVAAAIANDGVAMAPHVVATRTAPDGTVISRYSPQSLGRVIPSATAAQLVEMMRAVVVSGTGTGATVGDVAVAGKTGTAEGGGGPHAWFIGFGPTDDPRIAVAVVVEGGGGGGRVAAPIAARVIAAWRDSMG
ncbi:MAG: penicillin-binding transpeptidase domain-containing protein [Acidimicrobiia bacterium]